MGSRNGRKRLIDRIGKEKNERRLPIGKLLSLIVVQRGQKIGPRIV